MFLLLVTSLAPGSPGGSPASLLNPARWSQAGGGGGGGWDGCFDLTNNCSDCEIVTGRTCYLGQASRQARLPASLLSSPTSARLTDQDVHNPTTETHPRGLRRPQLQPLVHHGPPSLWSHLRGERGRETLHAGADIRSYRTAVNCRLTTTRLVEKLL